MPDPPPSHLRRLLKQPDARRRLGRAVGALLGAGVVTIGVVGALVIWHLVRRGRLIQASLASPRLVRLPVLKPETDPDELR